MKSGRSLVPRRAAVLVEEALEDTRVVVVNGARQVGKSTLAEVVLRRSPGGVARFLDDPATREAAQADPVSFLRHDGLLLLDEVQRVPDLWLAIKNSVDRDPRPGRFLLTGSARLQALAALPDALVGRSETIELWPLSQGEIDGKPDGFVDAAFAVGAELGLEESDEHQRHYFDRVTRGGYPEAVRRHSPARRRQFFDAYLSDLIVRDFQQVAELHKVAELRRLLAVLAAQVGGVLNVARLAGQLELDARTINNYLDVLEAIFVVRRVGAWSPGPGARAVRKPKVHFTDSGLAAFLTGTASSQPAVRGGLLENFVIGELSRQLSWSRTKAQLFHFRDQEKNEVDAILESYGGEVVAIEVKASESVRGDDFRQIRRLQQRLGGKFRAGYVLYCGGQTLSFGDGLVALPIAALWRSGSE